MVFDETQDVAVIVMLTQTFESGREKCTQYFPLDAESSPIMLVSGQAVEQPGKEAAENGGLPQEENVVGEVALLECFWNEKARSQIRRLRLTIGSESKTVWHFLFAGWADYSKPEGENRAALLELISLSASKCAPESPRVVHCSAGVGRTGTFIALDHMLRELESGELLRIDDKDADPVFDTVNQMREQRMMMVYNEMQFQFIYEVLREKALQKVGRAATESRVRRSSDVSFGRRSAKVARLNSNATAYIPSSKAELEPAPDWEVDSGEHGC